MIRNRLMVRDISLLAMYTALILALSFIPYTGYITVGVIRITTIPVIISIATWHLGFKGAVTTSITFGIGSYLTALYMSPFFANFPELAFVPRIMMGLAIWLLVRSLGKHSLWKLILTAACTVLFNTMFVTAWYFIMQLYRDGDDFKSLKAWMVLIYVNFIVELAVAISLGTLLAPLVTQLKNSYENKKADAWE